MMNNPVRPKKRTKPYVAVPDPAEVGAAGVDDASRRIQLNKNRMQVQQNKIAAVEAGWADNPNSGGLRAKIVRTGQALRDITPDVLFDGVKTAVTGVAKKSLLGGAGIAEDLVSPQEANAGEFRSPHATAHRKKIALAEKNRAILRGVVMGKRSTK